MRSAGIVALLCLRIQHVLDGGDVVCGAGHDSLRFATIRRDRFAVALLARALGVVSHGVEVLVEGAGGHVALVEEVPGAPCVRAYSSCSDSAARAA
jgi:hypothetical protein